MSVGDKPFPHAGPDPVLWAGDNLPQLAFTLAGAFLSCVVLGTITLCSMTPGRVAKHIILEDEISGSKKRKEQYFSEPRALIIKGYKKYRDQIWGIDSSKGVLVFLPVSYLDELKSHPALSFEHFLNRYAMVQYTGIGGVSEHALHKFKSKFNPTVGAYVPVLQTIVDDQVPRTFGEYHDWTEVNVYEKVMSIVGILSARAFMSNEASQDPTWLRLAPAYVDTAMQYLQVIKAWPEFMRPLAHFFAPQRKVIAAQWKQAEEFLGRSIDKSKAQDGSLDNPPSLMDHLIGEGNVSIQDLIHLQMAIVVAGIDTTSNSLTHMLYDLAGYSEGVQELREEVLRVYGENEGIWNKKALGQLEKMDSWMKESQRFAAPDLSTFQRMATKSFNLKDGLHVPKGTMMGIPTTAIHVDEAIYEDPDRFDGLRFYKMRQAEGQATKHQYISTGKNDLAWGFGRHACPGRFIADVEIKLCLANILLNYDIQNPAGQPRHTNLEFESN
ncbi:hypothetical protein QQZ08_006469 [Neonectria magnoliae]|uniref:Cytochrome P450 n=1 Tax=Neonectria magnoliae TaxID=2732573 RepID=A0ABR1I280_9HYPO